MLKPEARGATLDAIQKKQCSFLQSISDAQAFRQLSLYRLARRVEGRSFLKRISQGLFEWILIVMALLAALRMILQ